VAALSQKSRLMLVAAIVLLCVGLGLAWFFSTHVRETRMQPLPLTGEAAYNPFFALKRTLERSGLAVQSESELRIQQLELKPGETLIVGGRPESLTREQLDELAAWVESGGHLIIALQQTRDRSFSDILAEAFEQDSDDDDKSRRTGDTADKSRRTGDTANKSRRTGDTADNSDNSDNPESDSEDEESDELDEENSSLREVMNSALVGRFGLDVHQSSDCPTLTSTEKMVSLPTISFCPSLHFHPSDSSELAFTWALGNDDDGYTLAKAEQGRGSMIFAADLQWLTTYRLKDESLHALVRQLFDAPIKRKQRVVLVYGSRMPSLMAIILRFAWPILVPLTLALLLWAFARSARFGPLLAHQLAPRRALKEHVLGAGEFLFRRKRGRVLHQALLRQTRVKMLRKFPHLEALSHAEQIFEIAKLYQLDPARVRDALEPVDLDKPHAFIQSIKTLIYLRK
jgi:hypothetical protein